MSVIEELLEGVALPPMAQISQRFSTREVQDVAEALRSELNKPDIIGQVKEGMRVAIAVGSRGMAQLPLIVKIVAEQIKALGAKPFIVPAMGSHGGASAAGQKKVLASLGITEESTGCPIVSSMEVVELGTTKQGQPVFIDKNAYSADGIVIINRVKVHTAFSGANESGLVKMITIGLGKQRGADSCHALGFKEMADFIVEMARISINKAPFLFGIATVENAYEKIAQIAAVPVTAIIETDQKLLAEMKAGMPKLLLQPIDVLIVDKLGKEFSGGGMDPYITGRPPTPYVSVPGVSVARLVVLDVSDSSHGNVNGLGMADITTRRLFEKIDFTATYANVLTSTVTPSGRIPLIMASDRQAVQAAIKTCNAPDPGKIRVVRIPNTLYIDKILVSAAMLPEAKRQPDICVLSPLQDWMFDSAGNLEFR
ncbi:MAG: lactate racemase domain-containing protein [Negativicutes bacterium]|nr:lactate racemase domain-containing protein [Negativicutes bacterium]MDR3591231.1 lactate racemase domain-containing protein [Negativicutes bacterium]